jgi:predicted RNase H-like HicB family nuclease
MGVLRPEIAEYFWHLAWRPPVCASETAQREGTASVPHCFENEFESVWRERSETASEAVHEDWREQLRSAATQLALLAETKREQFLRLVNLEKRVEALQLLVGQLSNSQAIIVPITSLEPEPFELLRDIPVVVQPTEEGYLATVFDANIGMTGDTQEEAVANLKELVVDVFDELEQDEERLGPHPARQLAVLRSLIRRRQP